MTTIQAEFYQGAQGQLFRLIRTPETVQGHLLYLSPLFEQANQSRHMLTRSALNVYQQGLQSIIFDHFGTGDSAGELSEASLTLWQQDIISQLLKLKESTNLPIILSVTLSAGLLLNDTILTLVDGIIFVQAEFNGKRFIQQFKRLALAAEMNNSVPTTLLVNEGELTIAGYVMKKSLCDQLSAQKMEILSTIKQPCAWFEWQAADMELSTARAKLYHYFQSVLNKDKDKYKGNRSDNENTDGDYYAVNDSKYWQSTELEVATDYLNKEQQALVSLCAVIAGAGRC